MLMKLNIQLFASGSGSTTLSSGAGNKASLSVSFYETNASEPNVTNNTTNISASATMKMTSGSFSVSSTWHVRLYWHDNKSNKDVEVANVPVSALSRNQSVTASASFDVEHNADGTLSGYAIAKWDATGGNYTPYAGQVDTGWIALTTIPRATKITNQSGVIGTNLRITWSRASSNFTHTLVIKFGGKTYTYTGLGTYKDWTPPAELYSVMSGRSGTGSLTLTTYSGNNQIGSAQTATLTLSAVENDVKPMIDEKSAYDTNDATISLTTGSNVIVANKSLVQFNLSFHTRGYAKAKTLTINGGAVTIPNGVVDEKDASITNYSVSVPLGTLSSNSISISLTDTREYPATDTYPIEDFINYIPLDIAPTFKRIAPTTGEVGLSFSGNYFNDTFGKVANSLSIGYKYKENDATECSDLITLEKDVDYKIVDNTYHSGNGDYKAVLKLEAVFDYKKLYNVQLFVNDAVTTLPVITVTITKGIPIFWWNGEKVVVNGELQVANGDGENPTLVPKVKNEFVDSDTDTYSCNQVNKMNSYSTTGQRIGTWINGKPLYRKIIQHMGLASNYVTSIGAINNAETLRIKEAYLDTINDAGLSYPLNMVGYAGNVTDKVYVYAEKGTIKVYSSGGWSSSAWRINVIVEYTKTTD